MVKDSKPLAGSRAFWPRKRAKRIYPAIKSYPNYDKAIPLAFAGYKAGMVHVIEIRKRKVLKKEIEEEYFVPATVIEVPPLKVIGIRFYELTTKGYKSILDIYTKDENIPKNLKRKITNFKSNYDEAIKKLEKLDKSKIKKVRIVVATQPWLAGIKKKKPEVFEIEIGGKVEDAINYAFNVLGKEIKVSEIFKEGQLVDVIAVTKGKGTAGPVKRFGVKEQRRKATQRIRHVGSLGAQGVGRVLPGRVPMQGQLGFQRRTELNKRILKISSNGQEINPKGGFSHYGLVRSDYILIEGSVPGPKKRLIMIRFAIRNPKIIIPPNIKEIVITGYN
ncbi:MAG: 50S ribosomal protein L3 [Candidatus Aenigmatarchaeota archaeon]